MKISNKYVNIYWKAYIGFLNNPPSSTSKFSLSRGGYFTPKFFRLRRLEGSTTQTPTFSYKWNFEIYNYNFLPQYYLKSVNFTTDCMWVISHFENLRILAWITFTWRNSTALLKGGPGSEAPREKNGIFTVKIWDFVKSYGETYCVSEKFP